jgi:hypothetical protein
MNAAPQDAVVEAEALAAAQQRTRCFDERSNSIL